MMNIEDMKARANEIKVQAEAMNREYAELMATIKEQESIMYKYDKMTEKLLANQDVLFDWLLKVYKKEICIRDCMVFFNERTLDEALKDMKPSEIMSSIAWSTQKSCNVFYLHKSVHSKTGFLIRGFRNYDDGVESRWASAGKVAVYLVDNNIAV